MSSWFINKVKNPYPSKAGGIDLPEKLKQYMLKKRLNKNHNGELAISRSLQNKKKEIKVVSIDKIKKLLLK